MILFKKHTNQEHALTLADYLPGGEVFSAKIESEKNLFLLLLGFASQYRLIEERLELTFQQYDIKTTEDFLTEWESALGIPDDCFKATGSFEERIRDVNVKFLADTIVTDQDFIDLAALYGISVTIKNGTDNLITFPLTFPTEFSDFLTAKFTMIVQFSDQLSEEFPFVFPITFGTEAIEVLKCLFRKLAPANVDVIFEQV